MRHTHVLLTAALLLTLANALTRVAAQDSKKPPAPARLAVVDMDRLLSGYLRKEHLEKKLEGRRSELRAQLNARLEALNEVRRRDGGPFRESAGWLAEADRHQTAHYAFRLEVERVKGELARRAEANTLILISELRAAVRVYGRSAGYTMVFDAAPLAEDPESPGPRTNLLYHDGTADITSDVLRYVNSEHHLESFKRR